MEYDISQEINGRHKLKNIKNKYNGRQHVGKRIETQTAKVIEKQVLQSSRPVESCKELETFCEPPGNHFQAVLTDFQASKVRYLRVRHRESAFI